MATATRERLGVEHALLDLLRERPMHAYEMYERLSAVDALRLVCRLKQSHLYALLAKVEADGLVASSTEAQGARPPRRMLRRTPADLLGNLVDPQVAQALQVSMTTTGAATGITLVLGAPLAYLLARWRFRCREVLHTLSDLPMLVPPSVAGIALLVAFGRRGLVGQSLAVLRQIGDQRLRGG